MAAERLEVSIFRDLDYTKTFVSSVMRTDTPDGMGQTVLGLVRSLSEDLEGLKYTGKMYMWPEYDGKMRWERSPDVTVSLSASEENWLSFNPRVSIFGGAAYELYKQREKSPFANVLPGLHDVDAVLHLGCFSDAGAHFEHPLSRGSIDRCKSAVTGSSAIDQRNSPLSFLLKNIVSIISNHLGDGGVQTKHRLDDATPLVLQRPDLPADGENCFYTKEINDVFRVKVVDVGFQLRVQVDITVADEVTRRAVTDHVFELIIALHESSSFQTDFYRSFNSFEGMLVRRKMTLFFDTTASLMDRAVRSISLDQATAEAKLMKGKCAQDFLRILYIFLTELADTSSWIHESIPVLQVPVGENHAIKMKMITTLPERASFVEIFGFLASFIEPCVEASTIPTINVFDSAESSGVHALRDIIDAFQNSFPGSLDKSFLPRDDILEICEQNQACFEEALETFKTAK